MARFYDTMIVVHTDGTTEEHGGNKYVIHNECLIVKTENSYAQTENVRHFPLVNIKTFYWKGT